MESKINELYNLSKWKKQTEFVDSLIIDDPYKWLLYINTKFPFIKTDRTDKFYYLIDKLSFNLKDLIFISSLDNLRQYIFKKFWRNFDEKDILDYLCKFKVYNISINGIKINKDLIKHKLKDNNIHNRELLIDILNDGM